MSVAKTPTILQMEATECGAASLCMIAAYYGKYVSLEKMRIDSGVSRDGCKASNILKAARNLGFEAKGFKKSFESLLQVQAPVIIHWNFNHFLVFEGVKGKFAYLNDPAIGKRKITLQELDDGYTGIVLTFTPREDFVKEKNRKTFLSLIKKRVLGEKQSLLALLLVGILLIFPGLLLPLFSEFFIDRILVGGNEQWLMPLLAVMLFTLFFNIVLNILRSQILLRLQNKRTILSAHAMVSHLFKLPMEFFNQRYSADISSRVHDNESVNDFLYGEFANVILNILVAVFYLFLLLHYNVTLALIGVLNVVLGVAVMRLNKNSISNLAMQNSQNMGKLFGTLSAGISLTGTLKASGAENAYLSRLQGYSAKAINVEQEFGKHQLLVSCIPEISLVITNVLVLMLGGLFVVRGELTAGQLLAVTTLIALFIAPINYLMLVYNQVHMLKANLNRVDDIECYDEDPKFEECRKIPLESKISGRVELQGVSFGYSSLENPLIEDFSFKLNPGSTIAFVGVSGSGKSTVSKIVSGLFKPWNGNIFFDGIPVEQIPKEVLSASVSTVSQDISLFSGSIRDNLTMWNSTVMESDIVQAAKDACIHDVITSKPGAYDFLLSEGGTNMSGGERQRLEIARALVKNPTVLILDEATSALDPLVEKQVLDNIKRRGCTCIIVAHRLSTIRDADEIVVLEHGKVVERGNHAELVEKNGKYAELIKS